MKKLITILLLTFNTVGFSQTVIDFKLSECENLNSEYVRNRIVSKIWNSDTLLLKIGFVENCNIKPSVSAEQFNDSLYLLIENTSAIFDVCNCSFEIDLKLIGVTDTNFKLIYRNPEVIHSNKQFIDTLINEVLILNDNKYLFPKESILKNYTQYNQINKNGGKIGLWKDFYPNSDSIVKYYIHYPINNKTDNKVIWYFHYNEDKTLNKVCIYKEDGLSSIYSMCIEKKEYYKLIPSISLEQNWHLNKIDLSKKYPYKYWFQFENKEDTSTFKINHHLGKGSSTITLFNNFGEPIPLTKSTLRNTTTDSLITLLSNFDGNIGVLLTNGKYVLEVSAINYDPFKLEFKIKEDGYIKLNINLGLSAELVTHQINSKTELTENKIIEIMNCVKNNRFDFNAHCSEQDLFLKLLHI